VHQVSDEPGVLDVAASADRAALYAALQASLLVITDVLIEVGRIDLVPVAEAPVRRALRIGQCIGSDADLAARAAGDQTGHGMVARALREGRR
jgi:hypothetical protein